MDLRDTHDHLRIPNIEAKLLPITILYVRNGVNLSISKEWLMERQCIETSQTFLPITRRQGIQHSISLQIQEEERKFRQM